MSDDDKTGYGKPPKKNQFKPGQSGNPKGRPKQKCKSYTYERISEEAFRKALLQQLNTPINITENGETYSIPRMDAVLKTLTNKALKGEMPAIRELLKLTQNASKGEDKMIMELFSATADIEDRRIKAAHNKGSFQHYNERLQWFLSKTHLRRLDGEDKHSYEEGEPITNDDWAIFMTHHGNLKSNPDYVAPWPPKYPSDQ